jgi:hypothetical protein
LFKLVPLEVVVMGTGSREQDCTSGYCWPAMPVFPVKRFLQGEEIPSLGYSQGLWIRDGGSSHPVVDTL